MRGAKPSFLKRGSTNERIVLSGVIEPPVSIQAIQFFASPQWILQDKGWLCALRGFESANPSAISKASWPYSRLVDAPYQYFTGKAGAIGRTMSPLHFSIPVKSISLEFVQWQQRDNPGEAPSRVAWTGQTSDKIRLAGWIEIS